MLSLSQALTQFSPLPSGHCVCEPGFIGDKCLDQCPHNRFGVNCTSSCTCVNDATCDKADGTCHCAPGWTGINCAERKCPNGRFGDTCDQNCECEMENTLLCHPHDGRCDCKPGWSSATCNRPCPFLKYGENCASKCNCKNNAQCSPFDGACQCPSGKTVESRRSFS
jgi:multiple epidermal growth factor-like domains protein 10/11